MQLLINCYTLYIIINIFKILGVRLFGNSHIEGRVEVYYNGTWGTVCDDGWDIRDARVVCRQLDFGGSLPALAFGLAKFGNGTGHIWLDNVDCEGHESSLFSCSHGGVGSHNCGHRKDAGVRCIDGEIYAIYS